MAGAQGARVTAAYGSNLKRPTPRAGPASGGRRHQKALERGLGGGGEGLKTDSYHPDSNSLFLFCQSPLESHLISPRPDLLNGLGCKQPLPSLSPPGEARLCAPAQPYPLSAGLRILFPSQVNVEHLVQKMKTTVKRGLVLRYVLPGLLPDEEKKQPGSGLSQTAPAARTP